MMTIPSHRRLPTTPIAAMAALVLVASACSGGDGGEPPRPAAEATTEAPPPTTAPATTAPPATAPPATAPATVAAPTAAPATTAPPPATTGAPPPTTSPPPTTVPLAQTPPHRVELASGAFLLADRISQGLTLDQTLRFVLVAGPGGDGAAALDAGWRSGAAEAAGRHGAPIEAAVTRTGSSSAWEQAALIDELVAAGEADCLAVEARAAGGTARAIDRAVDSGVPVFTVSGDSPDSRRLAFYGLDDRAAGRMVGDAVGLWALEGRILLRRAGLLTGAAGLRLRLRMEGFVEGISARLPHLEFVNRPATAGQLGADAAAAYARAGEWILANPDVDIIFHPDSSLEASSRFIAFEALNGDVSTAGFAMSAAVGNYIRDGVTVAAAVPRLFGQAAAAAAACGDFLLAGTLDAGPVTFDPVTVTDANVDERDWTRPENG